MKKIKSQIPQQEPIIAEQPPVAVISPEGVVGTVSADESQRAVETGYQLATPEALEENKQRNIYGKGIVNQLEAGTLGFLRGGTFGLSDLAMRKLAPDLADTAAKLKKYNPDESTIGELASFAIPGLGAAGAFGKASKAAAGTGILQKLVAEGGTGLGAIAKKIVGENLAGQALGSAVNLAAQSAVYQAAHNISEDALGDKDFTAESILANTGQAAILGAGIGAALPVAARAAQAVVQSSPVKYAVSGAAKQFAKFFDPDRSLQLFTGAMKKELGAETGKRFQTAVHELANDSGASLYSSGEVALDPLTAKIVKTADGSLPNQASAYERVQSLKKQAGNFMGETLKTADEAATASGLVPEMAKWTPSDGQKILDKISNWESNAQIRPATAENLRNTVEEIGQKIGEKEGNLESMHQMRIALDERVGGKNWQSLGSEEIEIVKDMRRVLSEKMDLGLGELAKSKLIQPDALERWKKLNRLASNLYTIEKPLESAISRSESNVNVMGLRFRDIGIGAIGAGALGPAGAALGVVNKALQTDTGLLARANLGEKLQKLAWAEQLIKKSQADISKSISGFLSGDASIAAGEVAKKISPELSYAASKSASPNERVKSQQDWFEETRKKILAVSSNPEEFANQQGNQIQGFANAAPGVSDAIINKQLQAYAYLQRVMPKNQNMPTSILNDKWKPADYEVQKFRKIVQVVRSPNTILEDLKNGTLASDQVEAVKELYPKLYESILGQVRDKINAPGNKSTYNQRLRLGQMFQGTEQTLSPEFIQAMQSPASKPPDSNGKVRPPGGNVKLSKNYQTSTEKTSSR